MYSDWVPCIVMPDSASIARLVQAVKSIATSISRLELVWLALAAPFLLFPGRWTGLVAIVLPVIWACRWIATGRLTVPTGIGAPVAILCLMAAVGFWVSVDTAMSWAKLWGILLQAAVLFGLANTLRTRRQILWASAALLVATAGVSLASLVGTDWSAVRLVDISWVYDRIPRLIEGLPGSGVPRSSARFHPREVGATLAMMLPLPGALLLARPGHRLAALSAVTLAVGGAVLLLCQSVQALVGLALGALLIAAWRNRRWLLVLPLGSVAGAAAVWALGPSRVAGTLLSLEHPIGIGVILRLDMWSRAAAMIGDMPYTGVGLNTFPVIQSQFYPGVYLGPEVHAHNLYLQTALDLGLPGLLALLWLLAAFVLLTMRTVRATDDRLLQALLVGLAAGAVAFAGHGLFDAVTLGAKPVVGLFALIGVAVAAERVVLREKCDQERPTAAQDEMARVQWNGPLSRVWCLLRSSGPVGVVAAAIFLSYLVRPALAQRNAGLVLGHQVVVDLRSGREAQAGAIKKAEGSLQRAVAGEAGCVHVVDLLGSLRAWRGDFDGGIAELQRRVTMDGPNALGRYAPWDTWQRQLRGESWRTGWEGTAWIYTRWMNRYQGRAEAYVLVASVRELWEQEPSRARAVLEAGLAKGAQPLGLLTTYLAQWD